MKVVEHTNIPMSDGCNLSAKLWIPDSAFEKPVPAIFEFIPYRKRDFKAVRDAQTYSYYAEQGYAGVRVDIRGSGESEGILRDEYLHQELDDGLEILRWIARQPWCDGNIGMIGISWGGFNGLQIAALNPPELKAVVSVASSHNRYSDDVHYMGGNLLTDNLSWASTMFAYNSCPPDPQLVGEKWRDMWHERLEGSGLWLKKWLGNQRFNEYWKHGSVCMNYENIKCPVYAFGGWTDGYSNTVFHLVKNLKAPFKGLVGAWGHNYPHHGDLGESIDFLKETVMWWDRWLKGIENGIDKEPILQVWMQDTVSPIRAERPGHWVAESQYPSNNIEQVGYSLKPGLIDTDNNIPDLMDGLTIQSPLSVGLFAGKWCSYSASTDLPSDQREEDGGALVFDSPPLKEDVYIMGAPELKITLNSNKPIAMLAARLCDVAPSGRSTRITYGILNLTHRKSDEKPEELEPGKKYTIRMKLNYIAQRFPRDHQIRLALSTSYWPLAWPPPEPVRLNIFPAESKIFLPVRGKNPADKNLRDLGTPHLEEVMPYQVIRPAETEWQVIHNLKTNKVTLDVINNDAKVRLPDINWTMEKNVEEQYSYFNNNYDTLRGEVESVRSFERDDWLVYTKTRTVLSSTKTHFIIRATLDAYEGDVRVFSKAWDEKVKRDYL